MAQKPRSRTSLIVEQVPVFRQSLITQSLKSAESARDTALPAPDPFDKLPSGAGLILWRRCGVGAGQSDKPAGSPAARRPSNAAAAITLKTRRLHQAVVGGRPDEVRDICRSGADVSTAEFGGMTAIHKAAFNGNFEMVRVLVLQNADVNVHDSRGQTPLHAACMQMNHTIAQFLLRQRADALVEDYEGVTPARMAAGRYNWHKASDSNRLCLCLDHVLRVYQRELQAHQLANSKTDDEEDSDFEPNTPQSTTSAMAIGLVNTDGQETSPVFGFGSREQEDDVMSGERHKRLSMLCSPTHAVMFQIGSAAEEPMSPMASQLTLPTSPVSARGSNSGQMSPTSSMQLKVASPTAPRKSLKETIARAAQVGMKVEIKRTSSMNSDSSLSSGSQQDAAFNPGAAVISGHGPSGPALLKAAFRGDVPSVRMLLRQRAIVNSADTGGQAALHIAAYAFQPGVVQVLLLQRADSSALNCEGHTPLRCVVSALHYHAEGIDARRCAQTLEALLRAEERKLNRIRAESVQAKMQEMFGDSGQLKLSPSDLPALPPQRSEQGEPLPLAPAPAFPRPQLKVVTAFSQDADSSRPPADPQQLPVVTGCAADTGRGAQKPAGVKSAWASGDSALPLLVQKPAPVGD